MEVRSYVTAHVSNDSDISNRRTTSKASGEGIDVGRRSGNAYPTRIG